MNEIIATQTKCFEFDPVHYKQAVFLEKPYKLVVEMELKTLAGTQPSAMVLTTDTSRSIYDKDHFRDHMRFYEKERGQRK